MTGKAYRSEICRTHRGIIALPSLQVSCLFDVHNGFYESSKLKNWMCELCTFSQIRSHIRLVGITFPPAQHLNNRIRNVRLSSSGGRSDTKTMGVIGLCIHVQLIE